MSVRLFESFFVSKVLDFSSILFAWGYAWLGHGVEDQEWLGYNRLGNVPIENCALFQRIAL